LAAALLLPAPPASAHNYAATAYAELTEPTAGLVRTQLDIEYVLLAIDGAAAMDTPEFAQAAQEDVIADGQDPSRLDTAILDEFDETVMGYILPRFTVAVEPEHGDEEDREACPSARVEPYGIVLLENVPHARVILEHDCRDQVGSEAATYRVTSELFPGTEPGGKTTTLVQYDLLAGSGVASLDTDLEPTMTTAQDWGSRMGEFFVLGAEHLLFGPDHILFLLALIVSSRRLRDVILAATAFTVAHSVTFVLAALGLVSLPDMIVEPVIALSITFVAVWYLWDLRRTRLTTAASSATPGTEPMRREDWVRIGVVFLFGLIHGVGFAGALGIDEPFSWGLLGALLVFNLGIEAVQVGIILIVFPLLVLLRRKAAPVARWVGVVVSALVALVGFYWFVSRVFGIDSII
jgi:hydrogenase/urease accessory protein HupE